MDYYAKLHEKVQILTDPDTFYKEFTWLEPVMKPLMVANFATMQDKYTDAIIGNNIIRDEHKRETKIKVKLRSRYLGKNETNHDHWALQLWALPNQYTLAKSNKMLGAVEFSILWHNDSGELFRRYCLDFIRDALSGNNRNRRNQVI